MSLLDKMKKAGSIKSAEILSDSTFFNKKDPIATDVPIINIAMSADPEGGLVSGLTFLAGPSRHFKSLLGLVLVKAYMEKYKDAVCLFYDSEFGITPEYIQTNGIDTSRVIHLPIEHLEQLKFDISQRLEAIERGDKVIIFIDSVGNLASKKEVEDALDGKSVADMTRARVMKSLWRIVTPHLTTKDLPLIAVNHTYQCGTEKMTVRTPDGVVSIKEIKKGDLVLTQNGYEEVLFNTSHDEATITEIELENGDVLEFTSGHRFMVNGEWVYVCDLIPGMVLDSIS